jgi:hypothetical protein
MSFQARTDCHRSLLDGVHTLLDVMSALGREDGVVRVGRCYDGKYEGSEKVLITTDAARQLKLTLIHNHLLVSVLFCAYPDSSGYPNHYIDITRGRCIPQT